MKPDYDDIRNISSLVLGAIVGLSLSVWLLSLAYKNFFC